VAEKPEELVVYGGSGKAARDWPSFERICASLRTLGDEETLLVQSGKPVGVLRTHPDAPRVLIANSNLVPKWATWEKFRELERAGLIMYGQMTAGSWIYIGTQGILQARTRRSRRRAGSTSGPMTSPGAWWSARAWAEWAERNRSAAAMCGATFIGIEVDPARAKRRVEQGYLTCSRPRWTRRCARRSGRWSAAKGAPSEWSATRRRYCRSWCGAESSRTWSPTRLPPTIH